MAKTVSYLEQRIRETPFAKAQKRKADRWLKKNKKKIRAGIKMRYDSDRSQRRNWTYRTKYGITLKEYDRLLEWQGGVCAICFGRDRVRLCVDHDHRTKIIRGLLCRSCNRNLGVVENFGERGEVRQYLREARIRNAIIQTLATSQEAAER